MNQAVQRWKVLLSEVSERMEEGSGNNMNLMVGWTEDCSGCKHCVPLGKSLLLKMEEIRKVLTIIISSPE